MLYFSRIFYQKIHCFCNLIPIRCCDLGQSIFSCRQFLNIVWFLICYPPFNLLAVLIFNHKLSSNHRCSVCDITLGDLYFCHIIIHIHCLDLPGILHCKADGFCSDIALRSHDLSQGVFTDRKHLDVIRFFFRDPSFDLISLQISQDKFRSDDRCSICQVCLGDLYLRDIIFHRHMLYRIIIFYSECNIACTDISRR